MAVAAAKIYPIVYLDGIVIKVRQDKRVINKAMYIALGVNMDGHKELMGLWLSENEGAKFWLGVLTELQTRGVQDILIACVDGLKGLPDAINTVYPKTRIQLCIVHMVRNSIKFVPWKDYKPVTADDRLGNNTRPSKINLKFAHFIMNTLILGLLSAKLKKVKVIGND